MPATDRTTLPGPKTPAQRRALPRDHLDRLLDGVTVQIADLSQTAAGPLTPSGLPAGPAPRMGPANAPGLRSEWERLRRYAGGTLLVLCFALFGWQAWRGRDPAPVTVEAPAPVGDAELRVQVAGAVASPGVYRLAPGDRVEDAVRAAGGFAPDADMERVNLAQRVRDEQRLDIPAVGQSPGGPGGAEAAVAVGWGGPRESAPAQAPERVNVNTASAAELEALPGIGAVTAQRILNYRQAQGRIRSLDELRQAGIPDPLLRRAAGRLVFE